MNGNFILLKNWSFCEQPICLLNNYRSAFENSFEAAKHKDVHDKIKSPKLIAMNCQRLLFFEKSTPCRCVVITCPMNKQSCSGFQELVHHTELMHHKCSDEIARCFYYSNERCNIALTSFIINARHYYAQIKEQEAKKRKSLLGTPDDIYERKSLLGVIEPFVENIIDANDTGSLVNNNWDFKVTKFLLDARALTTQSKTTEKHPILELAKDYEDQLKSSGYFVCQTCKNRQEQNNKLGLCFIQWQFPTENEMVYHTKKNH